MQVFNFKEFISQLEEDYREFSIADTVAVYFKGDYLPVKINGVVRDELKVFRGSFCTYDVYDETKGARDYDMEIEMLVLEEYADSPNSIYIDESGRVNSYGLENISDIQIGGNIFLKIEDELVIYFEVRNTLK